MEINDIITLSDKFEYLILDIVEYNKEKYLYTVRIDEDEIPTKEYKYLKANMIDNELYIDEVKDKNILDIITSLFTLNYVNQSDDEQDA